MQGAERIIRQARDRVVVGTSVLLTVGLTFGLGVCRSPSRPRPARTRAARCLAGSRDLATLSSSSGSLAHPADRRGAALAKQTTYHPQPLGCADNPGW